MPFLSAHLLASGRARAQSVSALLLLLSHSVYYESEDAAAVALAQVRAVLVGLKVADHKIAPSAADIETQLAPDYLLSLLVLIFYLRNFNANLDPAADMQDLQESNRPMILDFVASFVHVRHARAATLWAFSKQGLAQNFFFVADF